MLFIVLFDGADKTGGIACVHTIIRDVFIHQTVRTDYNIIADGNVFKNGGICSDNTLLPILTLRQSQEPLRISPLSSRTRG